jgi:hypothetical protein
MIISPQRSSRALWFAVGGGPIAWSVDELAAIAIDHDYCAHGAHAGAGLEATIPLIGIALVAATIAILAGVTGWRQLHGTPDTGLGDTDDDRRRFMARFGMVISALMLFGILLRLIAVLFISPASC